MNFKPCWILCTPRTGSSYLCELLNNLDIFPKFYHKNMSLNVGVKQKGLTFNEHFRLYNTFNEFMENPCPYAKVILHQYFEALVGVEDKKKYKPGWYAENHDQIMINKTIQLFDSKFIATVLPNIKFILLKRNSFSQAVSLYLARNTKKYHIYSESELQSYLNLKIDLCYSNLVQSYEDAKYYKKSWNLFLNETSYLTIDYDELIADPKNTLNNILTWLEIKGDVDKSIENTLRNKRIFKMTRPECKQLEKTLKILINTKFML